MARETYSAHSQKLSCLSVLDFVFCLTLLLSNEGDDESEVIEALCGIDDEDEERIQCK